MVAGLESLSDGEIRIGDRIVNGLPPGDRDVAMVFQNYALYSHMTVEKNLGFALKARGLEVDEIEKRVQKVANMLELHDKSKFEIFGFYFGTKTNDKVHNRIVKSCDNSLDISSMDDKEVTELSRNLDIDIANISESTTFNAEIIF